ncbi:Rv3235 family protein [Streptomyces sp. NPDC097107]|uniref:Rv3235 family protein n=2 Tax=unclassified Streptomyces TaxID=2593676 RepID=UPI0038047AB5
MTRSQLTPSSTPLRTPDRPLAPTPPRGPNGDPTPRPPGTAPLHTPTTTPARTPGGVPPRTPGTSPSRAPGGVPPRRPGGRVVRAGAPGGRPPGAPGRSPRARTRPADTRPPTAGPGGATGTVPRAEAGALVTAPAVPAVHPAAPDTAAPLVPAQTPRRPVPQLRPTDRFAELLLNVLSGRRPVHSMLRHTAGRAYDDLAHLAERGPLRTRGTLPVVRDIGYFEPRPGALEVFARIGAGDQLRAMAFRLEQGRDLRWRCTAVELGGPRRPHTDDD